MPNLKRTSLLTRKRERKLKRVTSKSRKKLMSVILICKAQLQKIHTMLLLMKKASTNSKLLKPQVNLISLKKNQSMKAVKKKNSKKTLTSMTTTKNWEFKRKK